MALLLVGFGLRDSILDIAVLQYDQIQTYDGILVLDEDAAEEERASLLTELQENDQVTDFQEVYMKNLTMESVEASCDIYLMVPETTENFSAFVTMRDRQSHETYELGDDGIVLTEKAATILDVSVGDTISITLEEGNTQKSRFLISVKITCTTMHTCLRRFLKKRSDKRRIMRTFFS